MLVRPAFLFIVSVAAILLMRHGGASLRACASGARDQDQRARNKGKGTSRKKGVPQARTIDMDEHTRNLEERRGAEHQDQHARNQGQGTLEERRGDRSP